MDYKKIGIILLIIIGLVAISGCTSSENLTERPLLVDDNGNKIVSVNVSEDYTWGSQVHSLQEQVSEDDYEVIRALNCSNKTDLALFKDVISLCESGTKLEYKGMPYYKVASTQKLKNRPFNIYGGLKVKDINTCMGYRFNNNSNVAVVVVGTGGSHVAESLARVNFY